MKKIVAFCICMLSVMIMLVSCGKEEAPYLSYIGKTREAVFKELKNSGENFSKVENRVGEWQIEKCETISGMDYSVCLNFDANTDKLYGFYYYLDIDTPKEKDFKIITDLIKKISKEYGKPDTYIKLENRIKNIENFNNLPKNKNKTYVESWDIPKLKDTIVELNLITRKNGAIRIEIIYRILKYPV